MAHDNNALNKNQTAGEIDRHRNFTHYPNMRDRSPEKRSGSGVGNGLNQDLYEKSATGPNMSYQNSMTGNTRQGLSFQGR